MTIAMPSPLPLAGIRILDIGTRIAAPFAATLLGDFGAEVIKVELPRRRRLHAHDRAVRRRLLAVVGGRGAQQEVDHARPAPAARPGAVPRPGRARPTSWSRTSSPARSRSGGSATRRWRAINPDLILTRASVYGQSGPYRDRPGLDRNGIGFGGLLYITGYPDRPPVRPGVIISDYLTGVFNALAIMIALYHRDVHRGGGQWVDLALYESVFRILEHTLAGLRPPRRRARARGQPAAQLGAARQLGDQGRPVHLHRRRRRRTLPAPGARHRARGSARRPALRLARRARRSTATRSTPSSATGAAQHTAAEIEAIMLAAEVPVTRAYSIADIAADPHYAAREDIVTVDDPTIGPVQHAGRLPAPLRDARAASSAARRSSASTTRRSTAGCWA